MAFGLSKFVLRLAVLFLVVLAAASCGRRGNLEAPPNAAVINVDDEGREVPSEENTNKPDKPFILDPLL